MKVNDSTSKKPVSGAIQNQVVAKETPVQKEGKAVEQSLKEDAVVGSKVASIISRTAEDVTREVSEVRKDRVEEVKAKIARGDLPDSLKVAEKIASLLD